MRVPVPEPGPGELLLRVDAAGLCHSDLHVMDSGGSLPYTLPFTLGHEVAGTVEDGRRRCVRRLAGRAGRGVRRLVLWPLPSVQARPRERLPSAHRSDRPRPGVRRGAGRVHAGPVRTVPGEGERLGGRGARPAHRRRPHGVPRGRREPRRSRRRGRSRWWSESAGSGTSRSRCSALSRPQRSWPWTRVSRRGLWLCAHGADVVVADLALVDAALDGSEVDAEGGIDLVLDFVGSVATLNIAGGLLAPGGRLVVVGSAGGALVASKAGDLPRGWQLSAPFWGTRSDLEAVVAMAARGALVAESETGDLADAPELYRRLRRGEIHGRAVVVPGRGSLPLSVARAHRQH